MGIKDILGLDAEKLYDLSKTDTLEDLYAKMYVFADGDERSLLLLNKLLIQLIVKNRLLIQLLKSMKRSGDLMYEKGTISGLKKQNKKYRELLKENRVRAKILRHTLDACLEKVQGTAKAKIANMPDTEAVIQPNFDDESDSLMDINCVLNGLASFEEDLTSLELDVEEMFQAVTETCSTVLKNAGSLEESCPKPRTKFETVSKAKAQEKAKAKIELKEQSKSEPEAESKAELKAEPKAEPKEKPKAEPKVKPKAEPKPKKERGPKSIK